MTTPPTTGYPDFQKYTQWRGASLGAANAYPITSATPVNVTSVAASFSAVSLFVNNTGLLGVTLRYSSTDQTSGLVIDAETWVILPGQVFRVVKPVIGESLTIGLSTGSGGTGQVSYAFKPINSVAPRPYCPISPVGTIVTSQSVPASGSATTTPGTMCPGRGRLYYAPSDASGKLTINVIRALENGTSGGSLYFAPMPAVVNQPTNVEIGTEQQAVLITVANTDGAAAHSWSGSWVPNDL